MIQNNIRKNSNEGSDNNYWNNLEHAAILYDEDIVVGIAQHPVTKFWQTWISLNRSNLGCLTAHRERYDAVLVALDIAMAWKSGNLKNKNEVAVFLKCLPSDTSSRTLPVEVVKKLHKLMIKSD